MKVFYSNLRISFHTKVIAYTIATPFFVRFYIPLHILFLIIFLSLQCITIMNTPRDVTKIV